MSASREAAPGFGMPPVPPADGPKDQRDPISPRERLTTLVEDMLVYRANPGVTYAFFRFPDLAPQDLLTRLKDEASIELLVPYGRREMPIPLDEQVSRLSDQSRSIGVMVTAERSREGSYRRRTVDIAFLSQYEDGVKAAQYLKLEDDSKEPVRITIHRSAAVDLDSEYAGYAHEPPAPVTDEQAVSFVGITEELFKAWKESPEGIARARRKHVVARVSKSSLK